MLIIPVIDLLAGQVVHAIAGRRESYSRIKTPLCHGSNPLVVVSALMALHTFKTLYIADLDAINGTGNNSAMIGKIARRYPALSIWIDNGNIDFTEDDRTQRFTRIIATESGLTGEHLQEQRSHARSILSLDFSAEGFIGDRSVLENARWWPPEIIVMSLGRVGTRQGPDMTRLGQVQKLRKTSLIYAAGGVRNDDDIETLQAGNIAGALVATALHEGKISQRTLEKYAHE